MNRAAIDPSVVPLEPMSFSALSVPSLDELYQKMCVPDGRVVIRGVDWAFYEHLLDSIPDGWHIQVDYDGKDLELMSPISPFHDEVKTLLGQFVEAVAQELGIPYKGLGQTTWKRFEVARGLESDECYYFKPDKLAAADAAKARRSKNVADYPNPDLSIEVDISPSRIDRPGIYAALVVAEVWRFDHEQGRIVIERLGDDSTYHPVEASSFLPVRAEEIRRWVVDEDSGDHSDWARRLQAWARAELAPRLPR
jgi:Uma2 family endonuclease